ncbi:MAG: hypothetical protein LBU27_00075 [Candidatus Peribacteria bacterium]|jgi:hypothetical protein|nr:hypothetical protein [Candidatus Peribacteria bacterium]
MYLTFEESSDIALYHKYLTNEEFLQKYPFVKHKIEHLFPMLKEQLCNLQGDSTIVIADFIGALEKKHHTQIIDILEREKINFLDEENTITDIFINTMEYTTSTLQEYTVFFSLFPFSTF